MKTCGKTNKTTYFIHHYTARDKILNLIRTKESAIKMKNTSPFKTDERI